MYLIPGLSAAKCNPLPLRDGILGAETCIAKNKKTIVKMRTMINSRIKRAIKMAANPNLA